LWKNSRNLHTNGTSQDKELSDDEAIVLAEKIRDRIKNELTYPGTVTVNVIREVRAQAVAT
jgi:HD superfamily phosphodiesterase